MAKMVLQMGGWYIAYEIASSALLLGVAAYGLKFPVF